MLEASLREPDFISQSRQVETTPAGIAERTDYAKIKIVALSTLLLVSGGFACYSPMCLYVIISLYHYRLTTEQYIEWHIMYIDGTGKN
ncbi:hypothetical protein BDV36DRAFT_272465 [Aspergillus pseudocaelatus]|uniref:Uncharacterized protein n=1 Tax=Aspergillus pseudocaelatus TaxID=1825620 RepID=A0ABQ6W4R9_9EURO|nr:hypothetical protein BDV36DRAFT_272465 [Aspergillus pseudocaelatus]